MDKMFRKLNIYEKSLTVSPSGKEKHASKPVSSHIERVVRKTVSAAKKFCYNFKNV